MKTLFLSVIALLALFRASAQVSLELALDQDQFLPNEAVRVAVKITNRSGQQMHLGATADWLTFNVESQDDFVVIKNREVPVLGPFDLESSQMGTKHVDLQPYFQLGRVGRYKVTATMRIKEWGLLVNSDPVHFDVIHGAELWSQNYGVITPTNGTPEPRSYSLIKASYLRDQLRLYAQVSSEGQILKVANLGPLVAFNSPEEQVDPNNRLHVLWQTGAQSFSYAIVEADGTLSARDIYDNFNSRPHLAINTASGDVLVQGGVRRPRPQELPEVKAPLVLPDPVAPAPNPPAKP